jgi:hypothetical protein
MAAIGCSEPLTTTRAQTGHRGRRRYLGVGAAIDLRPAWACFDGLWGLLTAPAAVSWGKTNGRQVRFPVLRALAVKRGSGGPLTFWRVWTGKPGLFLSGRRSAPGAPWGMRS